MLRDPSGLDGESFGGIPAAGDVIASKYEVEQVLGAGGMGVVVAARHLQLGQRVAIKFMRGEAARDASAASRFLREARAAVALSSEHVTKVLDVGTLDSGAPYMVMEYLAGINLGEALRQSGVLAVPDAISTVLQACEAIAEAHMLGIVHRDLKPSNLFVTKRRDGAPLVKVLDFGISKTVDFNTAGVREDLTASGLMLGSPGYMSPEQLRSAKAVDARSDIWSLGVILYELLTGVAPFTGETLGETFARIIAEPPPSIRAQRPEVPEGLVAVVMQCLERNLDRRIKTVGELAAKLSPFAPREAGISVERIARLSAASTNTSAAGDVRSASDTMTAMPLVAGSRVESGRIAPAAETGPPWHASGPGTSDRLPTSRATRFVAVAVASVALLAAAAGIYAYGRKSVDSISSRAAVSAPTASSLATAEVSRAAASGEPPPAAHEETVSLDPSVDAGVLVRRRPPPRGDGHPVAPGRPGPAGPSDHSMDDLLQQRR